MICKDFPRIQDITYLSQSSTQDVQMRFASSQLSSINPGVAYVLLRECAPIVRLGTGEWLKLLVPAEGRR